ncbi:MAG: insulinase family protein, partial [candidate division Zixibacteria bacterium]|nr:insulinase family protein [candidate division Zixibacteria bacterium]
SSIRRLFGDWKRGTTAVPPPPPVEYDFTPGVYFVEKSDVNQSQIYLGHIGGLITDPDYPDRIVMNAIMGAGAGSRMFDVVRSREGLAYTTSSAYSANFEVPGVFTNYAATKSQSTGKAIREMIKVIRSMQSQPPTEQELKYGRDSYLNSFVFQFDTPNRVVNRIMNYDYFGLTGDFLQQVKDRVEQVTAKDVVAAANKNLRPDALRILVVGNAAGFDIPLDSLGLGPVHDMDIVIPSSEVGLDRSKTTDNFEKGNAIKQ